MTEYIQVFITINDKEKAKDIARTLLDKKLAACVQIIGPIKSLYRWEGKIVEDEEWLLIVKSNEEHYDELEEQVRQIHTYDVPEILAVSIVEGNNDYFTWMKKKLK